MNIIDALINNIHQKKNPSIIGLDPIIEYVPQYIQKSCLQQHGNTIKAAAEALLEATALALASCKRGLPSCTPLDRRWASAAFVLEAMKSRSCSAMAEKTARTSLETGWSPIETTRRSTPQSIRLPMALIRRASRSIFVASKTQSVLRASWMHAR